MIKGFLLEWIPWVFNITMTTYDLTRRIAFAAYTEAVIEKELIFLKSVAIPISSIVFPNVADTLVKWRVQLNPTRFIEPQANKDFKKHISYLGLTVYLPDGTVCQLTDWINDVKWSGQNEPTAVELFTIWCCEMGNPYFHFISHARFECINMNGDIVNEIKDDIG